MPTIPRMRPTLTISRPPMRPCDSSISRSVLVPIDQANGRAPGTAPGPGSPGPGWWSPAGGPVRRSAAEVLRDAHLGVCHPFRHRPDSVGRRGPRSPGRRPGPCAQLRDRPLGPAFDRPSLEQRLGVEDRPHPPRVVPQSVASRHTPPGRRREAASAANSGVTSRRLWCRFFGHGSGKKVQSSSTSPGPNRCWSAQTASTESSRTLSAPASRPGRGCARPQGATPPAPHVVRRARGRQCGRGLPDARADLDDVGAVRPKTRDQLNEGSSTASSGTTQSSWCASQDSCCEGVNRPPRRE